MYKLERTNGISSNDRAALILKDKNNSIIFSFCVSPNKYCCGTLDMGDIMINTPYTFKSSDKKEARKTILKFFEDVKTEQALSYYSDEQSTINVTLINEELISLFTEIGFKSVYTFINDKTSNLVHVMYLDIESGYEEEIEYEDDDDY